MIIPGSASSLRVIAHRGASFALPEHSRAAYRRALAEGADGLECDVRLTRDLVPVLLHDGRLDATTTGIGPVGDRTAAELDELVVSARRSARVRRRQERRDREDAGRIPPGGGPPVGGDPPVTATRAATAVTAATEALAVTEATEATVADTGAHAASRVTVETGVLRLGDFLALAAAAGRPVELALETKHPARAGRHLEGAVVAALAEHPGLRSRARVMSFSAGALRRLKEIDPLVPTVLLLADPHAGHRSALPVWADAAGPSVQQLRRDPELVARMHGEGHEVHVWTVDSDDDLDRCVALGVDVVISNRPGHVLRRLGR